MKTIKNKLIINGIGVFLTFGFVFNIADKNAYERSIDLTHIMWAVLFSFLFGLSDAFKFKDGIKFSYKIYGKVFLILLLTCLTYRSVYGWDKIINESRSQRLYDIDAVIKGKFTRGKAGIHFLKLIDKKGKRINIIENNHSYNLNDTVKINCQIGLLGKLFDGEIIKNKKNELQM